jgi:hypothetical protein
MRWVGWSILGLALVAAPALAGAPQIENVELVVERLQGDLAPAIGSWLQASSRPSWIGWHVPKIDGDQVICCGSGSHWQQRDQACKLEGAHRHFRFSSHGAVPAPLGEANLVVLLRGADGRIDDLLVYSDGCPLDAVGRHLTWLEGVETEASVDLLDRLITGSDLVAPPDRLADEALMALALHRTPVAAERLIRVARSHANAGLRGEALFWLAQSGAPQAQETILEVLRQDGNSEVRDQAVFALSQLPERRGVPLLLEIARDPTRPSQIRQEAFFWFVQEADEQAIDSIAEILNR